MSFRQRALPLMLTSAIGVVSGVYIFAPLLQQYALDSRGTFDPELARASTSGGAGGGAIVTRADQEREGDGARNGGGGGGGGLGSLFGEGQAQANDKQPIVSGEEARRKLTTMLNDNRGDKTSK